MKERPILFSAPMVRAILAGTKTQTRRVAKLASLTPSRSEPYEWELTERNGDVTCYTTKQLVAARSPYGAPSDRLWVRETWQALRFVEAYSEGYSLGYCDDWYAPDSIPKENQDRFWKPVYAATDPFAEESSEERGFAWRPGIHMPRWASRITLEVTRVQVERLHAITENDARAEGVSVGELQPAIVNGKPGQAAFFNARDAFAYLWAGINGPESWKANPWVWVVEFKCINAAEHAA